MNTSARYFTFGYAIRQNTLHFFYIFLFAVKPSLQHIYGFSQWEHQLAKANTSLFIINQGNLLRTCCIFIVLPVWARTIFANSCLKAGEHELKQQQQNQLELRESIRGFAGNRANISNERISNAAPQVVWWLSARLETMQLHHCAVSPLQRGRK